MIDRTCRGLPVWQQRQQRLHGGARTDGGPVLYSRVMHEFDGLNTAWYIGPAARAVDCSDLNKLIHAFMTVVQCTQVGSSGEPMKHGPDDVLCNPPVSTWEELVTTCEGLGPQCACTVNGGGSDAVTCIFSNPSLRVERISVGTDVTDGQQELCVPVH